MTWEPACTVVYYGTQREPGPSRPFLIRRDRRGATRKAREFHKLKGCPRPNRSRRLVDDLAMSLPLFDDNPAEEDLLGFDAVAEVVTRVVTSGGLDPVTVGIHSAWGGGKSTALNLIAARLQRVGHIVVVRIDPWEFENTEDLRGTLIAQVLNELESRIKKDIAEPSVRDRAIAKLNDLRQRIAWGRVAQVLVTSAVRLSPDIPGLVEALTPKPRDDGDGEGPQGMAGFRDQFGSLMTEVGGITKVVVLVDDLDRCLPPTIMGTLEAIKLFLSVKKMAFVIAADEDLIRAAIDVQMEGAAKGGFAKLYTEKIVQLPVSLPLLSVEQAEAYVGLLLSHSADQMTGADLRKTVAASNERRLAGTAPYVVAGDGVTPGPSAKYLALAASIAKGLSADVWRSPRAIKRFLNAFAVRDHLARAAGAPLPVDVLLKLYLLELRYLAEFQLLAQLSGSERTALVAAWEEWGRGERGTPPDDIGTATRLWAGTEPYLDGRGPEIERYLSVAATLHSDVRFGGAINTRHLAMIEQLSHSSDATRAAALEGLEALEPDDQTVIISGLSEQLTRMNDPEHAIDSLTVIAARMPAHADAISRALRHPAVVSALQVHHEPYLKPMRDVLQQIVDTPGLDADLVAAARADLEDPAG
jgi:KAP-like P-loop domain-containing protein